MRFDWREFLALAKALINFKGEGFGEESAKRTAVSRAYYAAFCFVRNHEEKEGGFRRTGGPEDHERLRIHLTEKGEEEMAETLLNLRKLRNRCDYKDVVKNLDKMLEDSFQWAEEIIEYFSSQKTS